MEDEEEGDDSNEAMMRYYERRKAGQDKWINELQTAVDGISKSGQYQANGGGKIQLTKSPFFDVELVGVPALAYLGESVYASNKNFQYLIDNDLSDDPKFLICGGKGTFLVIICRNFEDE